MTYIVVVFIDHLTPDINTHIVSIECRNWFQTPQIKSNEVYREKNSFVVIFIFKNVFLFIIETKLLYIL